MSIATRGSRRALISAPVLTLLLAAALAAATAAQEPAKPAADGPSRQEAFGLAPLSAGETLELPAVDPALSRPQDFLGYPLGERFTHWDRMLAYFEKLAATSPRVEIAEYGRSYEGRPLVLLTVSSPENLARLPEIRRDLARLADPTGMTASGREQLARGLPAVVWLAYGVHGNESSSSEAALGAAYALAAGQGEVEHWLENVIVVIDPLSNPDGRARYLSSYEQRQGATPNPRKGAAEHQEPWPGGRTNHYMIDLNRDWAWISQQETAARIAAYREWEPQVYVDFHEMGVESSYFFPPPADPVHPQIDRRTLSWIEVFGRANARAFDRQGWLYFKSESYDLFYPGYGDSYPSLRGAVGMTYEMAGGGRAGLSYQRADGTLLTLPDRVARHLATSLSTIATAASHRQGILEDFAASRAKAAEAPRTYLWESGQPEAAALAELLQKHGIRVERLTGGLETLARKVGGKGAAGLHRFREGAYAVSTGQPLGNLVEALLALESRMDPRFVERQRQLFEQNLSGEFYDVTAWSLLAAYNLEAWTVEGVVRGAAPLPRSEGRLGGEPGELGWLIPPQGLASYRLEAELQKRRVVHRVALSGFEHEGAGQAAGTIFIPRRGNREGLADEIAALLAGTGLTARSVSSSFGMSKLSLGSSDFAPVRPVHAGLVGGEGVDATSFGFLWSLLDRQVGVAHDRLELARLGDLELSDFDVLILPAGSYRTVSAKTLDALDNWVRGGGVLVGIGDAISWLREKKLTDVKVWEAPAEDPESEASPEEKILAERPIFTPGAILKTRLSPLHPLALGLAAAPPVLYEGAMVLRATGDPRIDVLRALDDEPVLAGLAWPEAKERLAGSLLVSAEKKGRGSVVLFVQDPAFRLFWRATTPLFLNAVLYGPSSGLGGR